VIRDIGVTCQIVTDETSMVVLDDASFARRGIERRNEQRVMLERQAQSVRTSQPARNARVDTAAPAFPTSQPRRSGGGGGALDLTTVILLLAGACSGLAFTTAARRKRVSGAKL
jgi:Ca-activated chloride channel family protein